jgi:hypothetical protein
VDFIARLDDIWRMAQSSWRVEIMDIDHTLSAGSGNTPRAYNGRA